MGTPGAKPGWRIEVEPLASGPCGEARRVCPSLDGRVPGRREALVLLRDAPEFRGLLTHALVEAPFRAFFWESPPVSEATGHLPCEWVIVRSESLAGLAPDPRPFARELEGRDGTVTFPNLGGDARLVVPAPAPDEAGVEAHLADFVRGASPARIDDLWRAVGAAALEDLAPHAPLWVSTSGLGVAWLHVRLDSIPKYVTHAPYRAGHGAL